jgi:hypothetical protein
VKTINKEIAEAIKAEVSKPLPPQMVNINDIHQMIVDRVHELNTIASSNPELNPELEQFAFLCRQEILTFGVKLKEKYP